MIDPKILLTIQNSIDKAPLEIKNILESTRFTNTLYEITEKYNYDVDEEENLIVYQLTLLILLGILKPEELSQEIKSSTEPEDRNVNGLSKEINILIVNEKNKKVVTAPTEAVAKPTPSPFIIAEEKISEPASRKNLMSSSSRPSFLQPTFSERYKEDMMKRTAAKVDIGMETEEEKQPPQMTKTEVSIPKVVNYSGPKDTNPFGKQPPASEKK